MPIPANSLDAIIQKVRLLTNSPKESDVTTDQIRDYVNTFVLYDFPEHIRISSLLETFEFIAQPNQETYDTGIDQPSTNQLYNFNNIYTTVLDPIFVDGYRAYLSQSPLEYNRYNPNIKQIQTLTQGNGATGPYTFTLQNTPILQYSIVITANDINNTAMNVVDEPIDTLVGLLIDPVTKVVRGNVRYDTGAADVTFANSVPAGNRIQAHFIPYTAGRPSMILWYGNQFKLRPVPDRAYTISFQVYKRPDLLLESPVSSQNPLLKQWWQYIAYGAAKKLLEDRMEMDMVALIMPEFEKQEDLVLRKSIEQSSIKRAGTIYANQTELNLFDNFGSFYLF